MARVQLLDLGVSRRAIEHRLATGRLRPRFRGVYAVGHGAIGPRGTVTAALLAMSPGAVASHWTAASLWEIGEHPIALVHITSTQPRRPQRGLVLHRGIPPGDETSILDGIPVTSVARTLLDLSATTGERTLKRLVKQAEFGRLTSICDLAQILDRYPRRQGRRGLARIVAQSGALEGPTRSELEDRFLEFCARNGLPAPETNVVLEVRGKRIEVDCLWREQRLIVELDGYRAHGTAIAFEDDRARDRALVAAGWIPMRATWSQLHADAPALAAELRMALHARGFSHA